MKRGSPQIMVGRHWRTLAGLAGSVAYGFGTVTFRAAAEQTTPDEFVCIGPNFRERLPAPRTPAIATERTNDWFNGAPWYNLTGNMPLPTMLA